MQNYIFFSAIKTVCQKTQLMRDELISQNSLHTKF